MQPRKSVSELSAADRRSIWMEANRFPPAVDTQQHHLMRQAETGMVIQQLAMIADAALPELSTTHENPGSTQHHANEQVSELEANELSSIHQTSTVELPTTTQRRLPTFSLPPIRCVSPFDPYGDRANGEAGPSESLLTATSPLTPGSLPSLESRPSSLVGKDYLNCIAYHLPLDPYGEAYKPHPAGPYAANRYGQPRRNTFAAPPSARIPLLPAFTENRLVRNRSTHLRGLSISPETVHRRPSSLVAGPSGTHTPSITPTCSTSSDRAHLPASSPSSQTAAGAARFVELPAPSCHPVPTLQPPPRPAAPLNFPLHAITPSTTPTSPPHRVAPGTSSLAELPATAATPEPSPQQSPRFKIRRKPLPEGAFRFPQTDSAQLDFVERANQEYRKRQKAAAQQSAQAATNAVRTPSPPTARSRGKQPINLNKPLPPRPTSSLPPSSRTLLPPRFTQHPTDTLERLQRPAPPSQLPSPRYFEHWGQDRPWLQRPHVSPPTSNGHSRELSSRSNQQRGYVGPRQVNALDRVRIDLREIKGQFKKMFGRRGE